MQAVLINSDVVSSNLDQGEVYNIFLVIYWRSVLLPRISEYPEKTTDLLYGVHLAMSCFELTTLVVIYTDCMGSCKSYYHVITTTTAPNCIPIRSFINILNFPSLLIHS